MRHVESTRALWLGLGRVPATPTDDGRQMKAAAEELAGIDIASHEAYADGVPHERFALLREHDPVHWHPWDWETGGFWAITKYDDVVAVSKDSRTFSSAVGHINLWDLEEDAREARRSMIETDPPEHTRAAAHRLLRVHAAAGEGVRGLHAHDHRDLLDAAIAQGEVDWVAAVSEPLPINVFVSILGIPDEDARCMIELTDAIVARHRPPSRPIRMPTATRRRCALLPFQSPAASRNVRVRAQNRRGAPAGARRTISCPGSCTPRSTATA